MEDYEKIAAGVEVPEELLGPASRQLHEGGEAGGPTEGNSLPPHPAPREYLPVTHEKYQGIASQKGYTQNGAVSRIQKTNYTHEAMIDLILAEPHLKQKELAARFGRTTQWATIVIGSDAFQAALAKRRDELVDPFLIATIEERFRGLAMQSLDVIAEKLAATNNTDVALKALDISSKALGFGARSSGSGDKIQNNFVVQLPPKAVDPASWAAEHDPSKIIEG